MKPDAVVGCGWYGNSSAKGAGRSEDGYRHAVIVHDVATVLLEIHRHALWIVID